MHAGARASTIWIGDGVTDRAAALLDAHGVGGKRFVVSSPVVWRLHGERIARALGDCDPILVPDGERFKSLQSVSRIYDALVRAGADRGSVIVAVGGGVIGDTAGFAAATFLRGVALAHIPTTLLAQVDSSVGGKVAVNLPLGKNLVGAFHQPAIVLVDPQLLATLPRREFRSGLYEVGEVRHDRQPRSLRARGARHEGGVCTRRACARPGHRPVVPNQGGRRLAR